MPDFHQTGQLTTLHDLSTVDASSLEQILERETRNRPIGLVLPVTADDSRAAPFARIIDKLRTARFLKEIVIILNRAPEVEDYRAVKEMVGSMEARAEVLWGDGPRVTTLFDVLREERIAVDVPGKGRSVWTAYGYLLGEPSLQAFVVHDCDIVNYEREMLVRLCFPMAHPSLAYEFCKAYYARCTDRMYGRVVRLLAVPLIRAMMILHPRNDFLRYLGVFRYPLSGEIALTPRLALSNRTPADWGLEVGTLAEVYRNTSIKRVCQVDLGINYEHKHQIVSAEDRSKGLARMASDIMTNIFRTLGSMGVTLTEDGFVTLRYAYLRTAQDSVRQYHADAVFNNLQFDRHAEEEMVEVFASQLASAGDAYRTRPEAHKHISNWARILAVVPDFPARLREAAAGDAREFG